MPPCVWAAAACAQGAGAPACVGKAAQQHKFCDESLPLDVRAWDLVKAVNESDKPALLTARANRALPALQVPSYYWGQNCIHSSMFSECTADGRCSTSFPSGPSWAATFDRLAMRRMAVVIGRETRAGFNLGWLDNGMGGTGLECWGPVINLNRDPRWGRNSEGGAEDPFLMGELAASWTDGLQRGDGEDPKNVMIAATLKHFIANSVEGGSKADGEVNRHTADATLPPYLLADYYFKPYRRAIAGADAKGVMCSYNSVNGVPACLSAELAAARASWNFSGYVTSDSDSISDAYKTHHYAANASEASCLGLRVGGCDIDSGNTFQEGIEAGLKAGLCAQADVDRALFHAFRVRLELGLFDGGKSAYWALGEAEFGKKQSIALNYEAAGKSLVLLRNPGGVLPLARGRKLAAIGPHLNATNDMIQVDTGKICGPGKAAKRHVFHYECVVSPVAALGAANVGGSVAQALGSSLLGDTPDPIMIAEAVAAAKAADAVVLFLGITAAGPGSSPYVEHETKDRDSIALPGAQIALAEAIMALKKPVVAVLLNGGAVTVPAALSGAAIVEAFYPGMQGSVAIADHIFGAQNRWGRMPYTVPFANWTLSHPMLDMDVTHGRTYRYGSQAQFEFGHGLSLTEFQLELSPAAPSQGWTMDTDGTLNFSVVAANKGNLKGDVVVAVYLDPHGAGPPIKTRPVKSLVGFERLDDVEPGAHAAAPFAFDAADLSLTDGDGNLVVAPGSYTVLIEDGSGARLAVPLAITGTARTSVPFPRP